MIRRRFIQTIFCVSATSALATLVGCTGSIKPLPVVQAAQFDTQGTMQSVAPGAPMVPFGDAMITINKSLLNQPFLYGADLQYSSSYDKSMDLYSQSMALGHVPAYFKISGNELQLIADDRRLFPSDVNHPDELISRYRILSQGTTTITVSAGNSGKYLAELFSGTNSDTGGELVDPSGAAPKDLRVRSVEFDPNGNYLLQQTTVTMQDGSRVEFMESVFPRATLNPGKDFSEITVNTKTNSGWDDTDKSVQSNFRVLPSETIHHGETVLARGAHFDLTAKSDGTPTTLDWYVTTNIKNEDLAPVKLAVEGWNRYFNQMKGINRPVMRFLGRLPDGIHLGDPRYNVINWDSRLVAGAAYESQAADPETGKQSHSLIYMPAAWLAIGQSYWTEGETSDTNGTTALTNEELADREDSVSPSALAQHGGVIKSARIACMRDMREASALLASGKFTPDDAKTFGVQLLKQTLFHEVGHSLGLAHNFRGSLTYDPSKQGTLFSSSIMDYNDFEIERGAFDGLDTSVGPQLEYDRQALSVIYNNGLDIAQTDTYQLVCNDAEADTLDKGVDPICIRYDIEKDPTASVVVALNRVTEKSLRGDVTLSDALARVPGLLLTDDALATAKDKDSLTALEAKLVSSLKGSLDFYLFTSRAGVERTVKTNVKSLLKFETGILPAGYDELAMRERAFTGVQKALALKEVPAASKAALDQAILDSVSTLQKTPYLTSLKGKDLTDASDSLTKDLQTQLQVALTDDKDGILPKMRAAVLSGLAMQKASYFFGELQEAQNASAAPVTPALALKKSAKKKPAPKTKPFSEDYETAVVGMLTDVVEDAKGRTTTERLAAAKALATFVGRPEADSALDAVKQKLGAEFKAAQSTDARDLAVNLIAALAPASDS